MNREIAKENLSLLKSIFNRHNITFWLAWGTCLGAIRDRDFIAHDNDIDLDVYRQDEKRITALIPELKAQGFELIPGWKYIGMQLRRKGEDIDIFFVYKVRKNNHKSGWMSGEWFLEGDFFSQLETIEFLGENYQVPRNPIAYLEYSFGHSWKQPIKDFFKDKSKQQQKIVDLALRRENLRLIKSVLEKHGIQFWLAQKTCLDAVKQNELLAPDTGLIINVYEHDKTKLLDTVPELTQLGFEALKGSYLQVYNYSQGYDTELWRQNELIRIDYAIVTNMVDKLKGYRWKCHSTRFRSDFFSKLETINFFGEEYYVPAQPKKYLNYLYGSMWEYPGFERFSHPQRLDLLAKILQEQSQIELPVKEPWLQYREHYDRFIPYGETISIKILKQPVEQGMIVLVRLSDKLSIKRVIELQQDDKICLTSDLKGQADSWCKASDIMGQVTTLHTRLGLAIALDAKIIQLLLKFLLLILLQPI